MRLKVFHRSENMVPPDACMYSFHRLGFGSFTEIILLGGSAVELLAQ